MFNISSQKHFENLDSMRFMSFAAIFMGHCISTDSVWILQNETYSVLKHYFYILGKAGFIFAFVMSGYINTWVILSEKEKTGNFRPLHFILRRALRIWPLYFAILFFCFQIFPIMIQFLGKTISDDTSAWPFIFFIGNFYIIEQGFPYLPALSVMWSVSVEEQFYLIWPWLLSFFYKTKWILIALLIIVFLVFTGTCYGKFNLFFHTLFMFGDLAIGAGFAFITLNKNSKLHSILASFTKAQCLLIYVAFIMCVVMYTQLFENTYFPAWLNLCIERLIFAFLLGMMIFEQNHCKQSPIKFGRLKVFSFLGAVGYGMFCFHELGILIANYVLRWLYLQDSLFALFTFKPFAALLLIVPAAILSYKHYESPFLRLKSKI